MSITILQELSTEQLENVLAHAAEAGDWDVVDTVSAILSRRTKAWVRKHRHDGVEVAFA